MSSEGSTEKLRIGLYPFVEGIHLNDVEFAENPNLVFVDTVCECYFNHSTVGGSGWLVTKLDEV